MISHRYKCIFIHIPRCAGTSIETWLCGQDWWGVNPQTKHLIASQARKLYAHWWDDYFKFAVVRDPYSRTRSLLKYDWQFGLSKEVGKSISFAHYEAVFGAGLVIEHDHRFARREELVGANHRPGCVYGNILDETMDFVGRVESLEADMAFVQSCVGFPKPFDLHLERSGRIEPEALTPEDRLWVAATYREDFVEFGYHIAPIDFIEKL